MMEKPNVRERHGNVVFVAGLDNVVVANGAARLSNELDARKVSAFDIVSEGKESI